MAGGAEQQTAVGTAIERIVHIDRYRVGRRLLLAQRDVILHAPHLLHERHSRLDQSLKPGSMFGRNGEVDAHAPTAVGSILGALLEMLLKGRVHRAGGCAVKLEQGFGQRAIVHAFGQEQGTQHVGIAAFGHEFFHIALVQVHTSLV